MRESAQPLAIEEVGAVGLLDRDELSAEDHFLVRRAFGSLNDVERRVIAGRYVLGLTQLEIARRLGMSAKRISRLHRAALGRMYREWAS